MSGRDSRADDADSEARSREEYQLEDDEYDPSEQEIAEYCDWLGMDAEKEKALTWIAREALKAPLPEYWKICYTEDREVYYFNMRTGESIWDHPMDAYYKSLFKQEKAKLEKKRKKMRLFSGSLPITPLQTFFSEHHVEGDLPEALCDPIDFMLLVDPVVLPTSGRTVSKHTIVNNKWRDPFSREYVENRRLIHNVDKRHEVDAWLRKELQTYFRDHVLFPERECAHANGSGAPPTSSSLPGVGNGNASAASSGEVSSKDLMGSAPPAAAAPTAVQSTDAMFAALMKVLPYLLDKEDEVCLEGQRLCLHWFTHAYALGKSGRGGDGSGKRRKGSHRGLPERSATRATPPGAGTPEAAAVAATSDVYAILKDHDTPGEVLSPLLTMSTSASLECLALILLHHPPLRTHPCFAGYNSDVLSVLQLTETDLTSLAKSLAAGNSNPFARTTNTDFLVKLRWCYLVMDTMYEVNVLTSLPWQHSFSLLTTAFHSLAPTPALPTLTIKMLRELCGWPENVKHCDTATLKWLLGMALAPDGDLTQQLLLLYDLLINSGDATIPMCKKHKHAVLALMENFGAAFTEELQGNAGGGANATANADEALGASVVQYSSMLGSFLVYHDICRLHDFAANPAVQLAVADALLPRLTRMQWKPKIFEATMRTIAAVVEEHPEAAWATFKAERVEFVLKELTKKKKNNDDLRARLEGIEATEKRLQQSAAINNWLLLSTKLARRSPHAHRALLEKAAQRRHEIAVERCGNFTALLSILLNVRLKLKSRDHRGGSDRGDHPARRKLADSHGAVPTRESAPPPDKDKSLTLPPI